MATIKETHPAYILLEDGTFIKGKSFGKKGTAGGELCFNTAMTGYQEVLTDPSNEGQVLIFNNSYLGNYGVNETDIESGDVKVKAIICRNMADRYSRFMATKSLDTFLESNGVVAIEDVDTRALVSHIRNLGNMNCVISSELSTKEDLEAELKKIQGTKGVDLSSEVATDEPYTFGDENAKLRVAVLDFGLKQTFLKGLSGRGVYLKVFPGNTDLAGLNTFDPDAYFISNGPGDPAAMDYAVKTIRDILETRKPVLGICLGHLLLARAMDIGTYKMHHGHRGANHPVKNLLTGKSEITFQSHSFAVNKEELMSAGGRVELTHINLNDQSVEGFRLKKYPAFAVQYHPEPIHDTYDSAYLFDDFISLIFKHKK